MVTIRTTMFDDIRKASDQKASNTLESTRHEETKMAFIQTQETILKAFSSLVQYLDNKVTKAEVVNQLQEVGTPDALKVVASIEGLHSTLRTHENTDLSPVVEVMNKVLAEAQKIPKELPKEIELEEQIDYSKQFKEMATAIKAVETAVKAQETSVEAPVVNVDAPVVKVDAPDFKPLEKASDKLLKAIQGIVIPEYIPTDIKPLLKEQKKTNRILEELPLSGGGGGGGGVTLTDLIPGLSYDAIDAQQTTASIETYVYTLGIQTVRTVVVTYTDATKADLDSVTWS
jgi:hypothetical protein